MRNGPGQLMARPVLGRSRLPTAVWWKAVWAAGWRRDLATGTLPAAGVALRRCCRSTTGLNLRGQVT